MSFFIVAWVILRSTLLHHPYYKKKNQKIKTNALIRLKRGWGALWKVYASISRLPKSTNFRFKTAIFRVSLKLGFSQKKRPATRPGPARHPAPGHQKKKNT